MFKNIGLFVLAGVLFFSACSNKDVIEVSGHIDNPGNIKVLSFYEGDRKLDSVYLADANKFMFEREATQPRLLSIVIGNNKYPVILTPGEPLRFVADLQQPEDYSVEGSPLTLALKEFAPYKRRKDFVQDSLQGAFAKATVDKTAEEIESLRFDYLSEFKEKLSMYTQQVVEFAGKQDNLAGFYAISTLDPEIAEQEIITYAHQIDDKFLDNRYVTQFKQEAQKLERLAVGQPAPQITSFTPDNKQVKLSDFHGKYTLVDFWASWCVPCRQENPNIVKQYHAFKDQGFTVLGVSLDNNPGSWMRAITDDKLEWTQVSDLQAWSSELIIDYKIKAIPTSYLLDPDGKILAKNLRGKELEAFLAKTFN
ncbi:TlpA disulfide reductase family protein [Sphingobacterium sp. JB170]|uniref:TlpA family protein disulfide reductase n=1 Tax=Sphingobacterium sp. JB170 TaxID=1434842 RepID=UPI00097EA828|nr:TlpA disulfide reductase family protein [Sphingobacterium sp. JB170]SJN29900.1 Thiol:disulfide interchange protein [Sphingobacterium sp. JB170]